MEQIPKDKLNDIIDQFVKEESSGHTDEFSLSYGEAKYYGSYLLVQNDNASYSADMNRLEVFVCYDQYTQGTFWRTIYTPLEFIDILIYPDGTVELEYEDGINAIFTTDMEKHLEKLEEDYTITAID